MFRKKFVSVTALVYHKTSPYGNHYVFTKDTPIEAKIVEDQDWMELLCLPENGGMIKEWGVNSSRRPSNSSPNRHMTMRDIIPDYNADEQEVSPPIRVTKSKEDRLAEASLSENENSPSFVTKTETDNPILQKYCNLVDKNVGKAVDNLVILMKDNMSKEELLSLAKYFEIEIKNPVIKNKKDIADCIVTSEMSNK